jgi:hypothetical protein
MKILAAAIRNKETGVVWSLPVPARHHDLIRVCTDWGAGAQSKFEQGFITDSYQYVDRKEARQIAEQAGQVITRANGTNYKGSFLFSEDVWLGQYEHIHDFCSWELFYEYRTIED